MAEKKVHGRGRQGRPPKSDEKRRSVSVMFMASPEELAAYEAAARAGGFVARSTGRVLITRWLRFLARQSAGLDPSDVG